MSQAIYDDSEVIGPAKNGTLWTMLDDASNLLTAEAGASTPIGDLVVVTRL